MVVQNRTGAIYKIQAGDRIWHMNTNEPPSKTICLGRHSFPASGSEHEIVVQGNNYTVFPHEYPDEPTHADDLVQ